MYIRYFSGAVIAAMAWSIASCSQGVGPDSTTNAAAPPTAASATEQRQQLTSPARPVYPDFHHKAFQADLDDDGKSESISFKCYMLLPTPAGTESGDPVSVLKVNISEQIIHKKVSDADLIECRAASIATSPDAKIRHLIVVVEHEDVSPSNLLFAWRGGKPHLIWNGVGHLEFLANGSFALEVPNCNEADHELTTTTETMKWTGSEMKVDQSMTKSRVEQSGCSGP